MFPPEFIKRLKTQEYIDSGSLLEALGEPSPVSILVNPGKWNQVPGNSVQVPWCENGYYLESRPSFTLDPLFHAGCYYPREASGMFLGKISGDFLRSAENLRVLDLCAAPGGKSIQISDLIGSGSVLVSNEVIRSRAAVLGETVSKWGKGNTIVTQNDASAFSKLKGYFDVIVVDAPCSGEGMFRNEAAIREWSSGNTGLCAARQKRILMDIWPSLKENGLLVYSTCTFNPAENEENIIWLSRQDESESLRIDVSSLEGITEISRDNIYGYGFFPGKIRGEGFFISVVRKTSHSDSAGFRKRQKPVIVPAEEFSRLHKWASFPQESYIRKGNYLISAACSPAEYEYLAGSLNVIKAGTLVSTMMKDDHIPSHELALSQHIDDEAFPVISADYDSAMKFLGRGEMKLTGNLKGWNAVKYKETYLGFVKNIGTRLNNYYPVDWRVRMDVPQTAEQKIIRWKT